VGEREELIAKGEALRDRPGADVEWLDAILAILRDDVGD